MCSRALPLPLLLLALSTLFAVGADKGHLYPPFTSDLGSEKVLIIVEQLSPEHNFLMFMGLRPGRGDALDPGEPYNRFPVGSFVLIKLATLPFGDDLSAKILAARLLMLLLFSAAALLAYRSLAHIASSRWIALAATLVPFSSYYMLFFRENVFNEGVMDLFAVMLVFHGMTVFVQEGRFRQLLAKACVALLLGWHAYAFLLPFVALGLAKEAMAGRGMPPSARSAILAALGSRHAVLGVVALLFGVALLGFNFGNEYAAWKGERSVAELPSFQSMLRRTGLASDFEPLFSGWRMFLEQQLIRVGGMSIPYMLAYWGLGLPLAFIGAFVTVASLLGSWFAQRHRILLAVLILSGFCWTLPMRHNSSVPSHEFESLFYLGVPLAFFSLSLLRIRKRWGERPVVGFACAALLMFVVSVFQMDERWGLTAKERAFQKAAIADAEIIRERIQGEEILVIGPMQGEAFNWFNHPALRFYFSRSVVRTAKGLAMGAFDPAGHFIVSPNRIESSALLTPENKAMFLYAPAGLPDLLAFFRSRYQNIVSGTPLARSEFDIYLEGNRLIYAKEPCAKENVAHHFFADLHPQDLSDLSKRRWLADSPEKHLWQEPGFERIYLSINNKGVILDGKCMLGFALPDYPISSVLAGQVVQGGRLLWKAEVPLGKPPEPVSESP